MKNKIKSQKGSITLFVLISMIFLIIVIVGIYIATSNKAQKQEKEIEQIQQSYEKTDINTVYEKTLTNYEKTLYID